MVGGRKRQYGPDELLKSYFEEEALYIFHPDYPESCHKIIGQYLSQFIRTTVREDSQEVGQTNVTKNILYM